MDKLPVLIRLQKDKQQLLVELQKVMDEYEYRLYPRDWVIVLSGMAWDRMKEADDRELVTIEQIENGYIISLSPRVKEETFFDDWEKMISYLKFCFGLDKESEG